MEGLLLHTIPLFRLFPGRPKSTFFSSSFFFGAILFLCLAVETENVREAVEKSWRGAGGGLALC